MVSKPLIQGPIEIVYKFGTGSANIKAVFKDLQGRVSTPTKFIRIYYDDPVTNSPENVRCAIGAIAKIEEKPELMPDTVKTLGFDGYKYAKLPAIESAVVTEFCNTTFVSRILARWRVHSYLSDFKKENKLKAYPLVEFYDGKKINYCLPLSKHEEFYLPEDRAKDS